MKILKYLLNYISLFMTVLVVFVLVYFRAEIFPENFNKPIDASITIIEDKLDIKIPSYQPTESIVEVLTENIAEPIESTESTDDIVIETAVESSVPEVIYEDEKNTDVASKVKVEKALEKFVSPLVDQSQVKNNQEGLLVTKINKQTEVVGSSAESITVYQARRAYWRGDIKTAEKIYKELTENSHADANVYGELGNIYYLQGKWKEAGDVYYEAAIRLIDNKQYAQVNYLLRVIQGLNPNMAKKLQKKMFG